MNNKNADAKKIFARFEELKKLDPDYKQPTNSKNKQFNLQPNVNSPTYIKYGSKNTYKNTNKIDKEQVESKGEVIYTQSQISKEVSKLKPYLAIKNNIMTTEEKQEMSNKEVSQQNYKIMSQLAILENRKLCEIVDEAPEEIENNTLVEREEKQLEGWVFEIFYRISTSPKQEISKKIFQCGYAVMTEAVEIYESLTFQKMLFQIQPSSITMVKYEMDSNYEIISIEQGSFKIQCGFLNPKKFELFDRMLFLQKNMSRSTSTRLFQNQLIRSIYSEYQKN